MENSKQLDEYLEKVTNIIASDEDIKNYIDSIEKGIKTTKNNYGKYMQFLNKYSDNKVFCYGIAEGIKKLGANVDGVNSAMKIIFG